MKDLSFLIVLALIILTEVSSQSCLLYGITFSTQEEVDNFQPNYLNCTEPEGGVANYGDYIDEITSFTLIESDCYTNYYCHEKLPYAFKH